MFVGMMIEGDAVLFSAAFLTHRGFFDFVNMAAIVVLGVLIGDSLWYWLGMWLDRKFPAVHRWLERATRPFDAHLVDRPLRTIFVSKFVYGLHHPLLMRAGVLGIAYKKFLKSDIISSAAWMVIVGGIGFFSSVSFFLARRFLRFAEVALLLGLLIFFFVWHFIAKSTKAKL